MKLEELGWDEDFAETELAPGLVPARVVMTRGPISRVHDGDAEHDTVVSGKLRHGAAGAIELPVVGDWVVVRKGERSGELGTMEAVLPRRTLFVRRAAGEANAPQALAANIDTVFIVMGLDGDFNVRRLERYVALAHASGAEPVVVLSKADLCDDVPLRVAEAQTAAPGVPVVSAIPLRSVPPELRAWIVTGRTVALLGSSGAGKSTLLNRLLGGEVQKTQETRKHDARGRHTTSHRQLFFVPGGGLVIDSPGLREIQLWEADEGLDAAFDDIEELARGCHFRDCQHEDEPGCAVRAAVEAGTLPEERRASWHKLRREAEVSAAAGDALVRKREKSGQRMMSRLLRARLKEKKVK